MAGFHERSERDRIVKNASERSFGLTIAGVLVLWALWPLWKAASVPPAHLAALCIALVLASAAAIRPKLLAPLNVVWMKIGRLLEYTVTPIIICLLFILVFVPFGVVLRLAGVLKMRDTSVSKKTSYWEEKENKVFTAEHFKRQF